MSQTQNYKFQTKKLKIMKTTILTFYVLITTLTGCSDDTGFTPTLPAITQTGENTFGCYVDGKLLTPRDGTGTYLGADRGMKIHSLTDTGNNIYDEIRVRDFKGDSNGIMKIHFADINTYSIGEFIINESNCEDGLSANTTTNLTLRWYGKWYCSINNGGVINFSKLDEQLFNYSGTFSCTVQNREDSSDIIEITEGRFDIGPGLSTAVFP